MTTTVGTKRLLILFCFVVGVFLFLGYLVQQNTSNLRQEVYDQCLTRNDNIQRQNDLFDGLIKIEEDNPFADNGDPEAAHTVQERIDLYTEAKLTKINCKKEE